MNLDKLINEECALIKSFREVGVKKSDIELAKELTSKIKPLFPYIDIENDDIHVYTESRIVRDFVTAWFCDITISKTVLDKIYNKYPEVLI